MLCGTPSIIAMGCFEAALDELLPVSMAAIRNKSTKLTRLFIELMKERCADFGFTLISSENDDIRGSQISYTHAARLRNYAGADRKQCDRRFPGA